ALFFVEGKSEKDALNQKFWSTKYGYSKDGLLKDLKKLKLIEFGFDINSSLDNLKVNDLKDILRKNNLKLSGNKKDLIDRIIEHSSLIAYKTLPSVILLTSKAKE